MKRARTRAGWAAPLAILCLVSLVPAGCTSNPPRQQGNLCSVFDQEPDWYDYARASERRWGSPIAVQMAFVKKESAYRGNARPEFEWFLFIPLGRASSAEGYAQVLDGTWEQYKKETGAGMFASRGDMKDALDFIGWYNHKSRRELGIPATDAYRLYLAYQEGQGGYRRGTYRAKPEVIQRARRTADIASTYSAQLRQCEQRFQCRKWYQVGPFCDRD